MLPSAGALAGDETYMARLSEQFSLRLEPDPRILGLGGAYAAASGDRDGLVGNPAALGFARDIHLSLDGGWTQMDAQGPDLFVADDTDGDYGHGRIGYVLPILDLFTLGLGFERREGEDDYGQGDYDFDRNVLMLTFAKDVVEDVFSIAYRFHWFDDDWSGSRQGAEAALPNPPWALVVPYSWDTKVDNEAFLHTLGAQWRALENLTFGLLFEYGHGDPDLSERLVLGEPYFLSEATPPPPAVRQALLTAFENDVLPVLRSDYTLNSGDGDQDEFHVRGGVAWTPREGWPLFTLDLAYRSADIEWDYLELERDVFSVHTGAEHRFNEYLTGRLGYSFANVDVDVDVKNAGIRDRYSEDLDVHTISTGLTIHIQRFLINYGFALAIDDEDENMMHYAGVAYSF